jgi:hypothetical protein
VLVSVNNKPGTARVSVEKREEFLPTFHLAILRIIDVRQSEWMVMA